jgi:hypothetical protein
VLIDEVLEPVGDILVSCGQALEKLVGNIL